MSDIERMAREAGFDKWKTSDLDGESELDRIAVVGEYPCGEALTRFAALVRAQALEDAARVADKYAAMTDWPGLTNFGNCAAAIRALGPAPKCCAGGPQWGHAWDCPKCPD